MNIHVSALIDRFGGLAAFARCLGHKNMSTAQRWRDTERIPHWRHAEVLRAARAAMIHLSAEEIAYLSGQNTTDSVATEQPPVG